MPPKIMSGSCRRSYRPHVTWTLRINVCRCPTTSPIEFPCRDGVSPNAFKVFRSAANCSPEVLQRGYPCCCIGTTTPLCVPPIAVFRPQFSTINETVDSEMSGQRTASTGGEAASVAAGCSLRESTRPKASLRLQDEGLAVFSWGRGEDGQLGLGDTRYSTLRRTILRMSVLF